MAMGIPTHFVRKLYRILSHESPAIICWEENGVSFTIHDSAALDEEILPRYFRGRLCAFRQQLVDHGFARCDREENDMREEYQHPGFLKGQPGRLSIIERKPKRNAKITRENLGKKPKRNNVMVLSKTISTLVEPPKPQQNRISLKVTLNMPPSERQKKSRQGGAANSRTAKKSKIAPVQMLLQKSNKPLLSDDPESETLSRATFVKGTGLLPASSELPDPISYFNISKEAMVRTIKVPQMNEAEGTVSAFSDDMLKSALLFLASSSCTGVKSNNVKAVFTTTTTAAAAATLGCTAITTSTSDFLASLLASSSPKGTSAVSFAKGSNPLFSDQTTDGGDDSIWNILLSSSVDRVRSTIGKEESPQERLRLILEEREKLEEQRKKVGATARRPTIDCALASVATDNSRLRNQQNPLFTPMPSSVLMVEEQREPAEDYLCDGCRAIG